MIGDVSGSPRNGYLVVHVNKEVYYLHRLAFLYMEGYIPEHFVDHLNGVRDDNRWCNLRHVSNACNLQNCKCSVTNRSGFSGVSWHKGFGKWVAQGVMNGRPIHLGGYATVLEAALARYTWEVQCSKWTCNYRSVLVKQIKAVWPAFNPQ